VSSDGEVLDAGDFEAQTPPASTALEVTALPLPGMMIELDGIAVR
jgi:enamine deaminase RidA (YjgF/YER057c/UK114 family)